MIEETIKKIEKQIQSAPAIKPERKEELGELLSTLREEVTELSKTKGEQAESIAGFTERYTSEAIREEQDEDLLDLSLKGLTKSVSGFEASHPRLVQIVNAICQRLADMGI